MSAGSFSSGVSSQALIRRREESISRRRVVLRCSSDPMPSKTDFRHALVSLRKGFEGEASNGIGNILSSLLGPREDPGGHEGTFGKTYHVYPSAIARWRVPDSVVETI
ncbi:MAG: hypothetical protein O6922_00850 [Chloroflexi bacterium]|nr:hypothetical protein [Chloroflexota bacterium]